ncbi:hypothetical protein ACFWZW_03435 [Microbacterium enclense]|uniref:hypothetical protein n=1 Tax=Microbacterium enclense TaxID=993073 RepID=UPI0036D7B4DD
MSPTEEPADEGKPTSARLADLQRRALEIERKLKGEMGKTRVADLTGEGTDAVSPAVPGDETQESAQADEEPTSIGLAAVKLRQRQLKLDQREQDMKLRERLANYAIWIVIIQVGVANLLFAFYLWHNPYDPDAPVMIAWLSATVVEVIGILWVIARNLFPYRDKSAPLSTRDSRRADR